MIFNYSFTVLADGNVESSEPETTYIENIETTESNDTTVSNDTTESIEESESEEELEEEIKKALIDSSEDIEEPEADTEEIVEDNVEEPEGENDEFEEVDISSSSEVTEDFEEDIDEIENDMEEPEEEPGEDIIETEKESDIKNNDETLSEDETEFNVENEEETAAIEKDVYFENELNNENTDEVATGSDAEFVSEIEENNDDIVEVEATPSELEVIENEKCNVVVYYLTDMKLKDRGNGGSYNYSWDTFIIDKNEEFNIDEKIPKVIKHSSCEQEYTLVGFTTENQIDTLWKGADYAGGEVTLEKNFIVDNDMEIFVVYEAKDTYISSIIIDNEITYKTTTIPNKAIKNILISENADDTYVKNENVKYYKIKNNIDNTNYMFTKDSSEGEPIKVEDFSIEKYKNIK